MKKILLLLFAALLTIGKLSAQNQPRRQQGPPPPPVPVREVSGIVKDTTDATVPGAVVKLVSKTDSVTVAANMDGIFVFKNIKAASFVLTVSSIGYRTQVKNMKNNDAVAHLVLDPIILKSDVHNLKEVTVNGTPSIIYKVDTIEYKASDYHVRENATLDELLKKMEGFEIGSDGSATFQGQNITKIKLNGKDYGTGDVAQGIQNLPADIIEKAQVVDDYGDQAAHTGIKSGDPNKILNVTTKPDRSVGITGRLTGQAGNHNRYNAQLFLQRINANQQIGIIGGVQNLVTGIQSAGAAGGGGGTGGNPGTALRVNPSFNYRDQYGPKVQVNGSIGYTLNNRNSTSQSYGSNSGSTSYGTFSRSGTNQTNTNGRQVNFELDYQIDSLNYLQIQPNYSYSTTETYNTSDNDNISHTYQIDKNTHLPILDTLGEPVTVFQHLVTNGYTNSKTPTTSAGALALFVHRFRKPQRTLSFQGSYNWSNSQTNSESNNDFKYYADSTRNIFLRDSVPHIFRNSTNVTNTIRGSLQYTEPLGQYSRFEFNAQTQYNSHSTNTITQADSLGVLHTVDTLSVKFNYATTDTKMYFNYRYQGTKVNLTLGMLLEPYNLNGTKLDASAGQNVDINKSVFKMLPVFRLSYAWSRTERIQLNYTSSIDEPQFAYLAPYTDYTDINNIKIGNSDLRPSLVNGLNLQYNNYFPNSRFTLSGNVNASYTQDEVTTNVLTKTQIITKGVGMPGDSDYVREVTKNYSETHYVNLSGDKSIGGNYNIAKQLSDRRYNLELNGRIQYNYNAFESDSLLNHQTSYEFNERFGPRINPNDNVEVNPYVSTDLQRTFSTTLGHPWSKTITNSLGIDGRFYFLKTFNVHYDARKQLITRENSSKITGGGDNSPLIIDGGFQKEFGNRRQFTLTFDVFDILHQNNYIQQVATNGGITNTISSSLSRYFLIGFRLNLQKWSGRPQRGGRDMQRRGDGSFIYN